MRLPDNRCHVVLAVGLEADVAQQHHLVVALDFLEGALQQVDGVHCVAVEELVEGLHYALRRASEALAQGIVAGPADQRLDPETRRGGKGVVSRFRSRWVPYP